MFRRPASRLKVRSLTHPICRSPSESHGRRETFALSSRRNWVGDSAQPTCTASPSMLHQLSLPRSSGSSRRPLCYAPSALRSSSPSVEAYRAGGSFCQDNRSFDVTPILRPAHHESRRSRATGTACRHLQRCSATLTFRSGWRTSRQRP